MQILLFFLLSLFFQFRHSIWTSKLWSAWGYCSNENCWNNFSQLFFFFDSIFIESFPPPISIPLKKLIDRFFYCLFLNYNIFLSYNCFEHEYGNWLFISFLIFFFQFSFGCFYLTNSMNSINLYNYEWWLSVKMFVLFLYFIFISFFLFLTMKYLLFFIFL